MSGELTIPAPFAAHIRAVFGARGETWVEQLPAIVAELTERWSLQLDDIFPLSYNYVVAGTRAGEPVVLKVGVPHRELFGELESLRIFNGRGVVRLLEADRSLGAMLLERVEPGTPLAALAARDDDQATRIAAETMPRLWQPAPADHAFATVAGWVEGLARHRERFGGTSGPLPEPLFALAESLFAEQLAAGEPQLLLHGDLHHDNILAATREPWLVIDPKGLVGDPGFEVGALMHNPIPAFQSWPDRPRFLRRRLDILSEVLGFERERVWAWGTAFLVLSAVWSAEVPGDSWKPTIAIAEELAALRP